MAAPPLFVDSSAWIALLHRRDQAYAPAAAAWAEASAAKRPLVTTSFVVAETHAFLVNRLGLEAARTFLDAVLPLPSMLTVFPDAGLVRTAVAWLARYRDAPFSLADAVSFEVMTREGITDAFTFDHHFARAGFRLVPAAETKRPRRRT
jgi:hypothetical protein